MPGADLRGLPVLVVADAAELAAEVAGGGIVDGRAGGTGEGAADYSVALLNLRTQ